MSADIGSIKKSTQVEVAMERLEKSVALVGDLVDQANTRFTKVLLLSSPDGPMGQSGSDTVPIAKVPLAERIESFARNLDTATSKLQAIINRSEL